MNELSEQLKRQEKLLELQEISLANSATALKESLILQAAQGPLLETSLALSKRLSDELSQARAEAEFTRYGLIASLVVLAGGAIVVAIWR